MAVHFIKPGHFVRFHSETLDNTHTAHGFLDRGADVRQLLLLRGGEAAYLAANPVDGNPHQGHEDNCEHRQLPAQHEHPCQTHRDHQRPVDGLHHNLAGLLDHSNVGVHPAHKFANAALVEVAKRQALYVRIHLAAHVRAHPVGGGGHQIGVKEPERRPRNLDGHEQSGHHPYQGKPGAVDSEPAGSYPQPHDVNVRWRRGLRSGAEPVDQGGHKDIAAGNSQPA